MPATLPRRTLVVVGTCLGVAIGSVWAVGAFSDENWEARRDHAPTTSGPARTTPDGGSYAFIEAQDSDTDLPVTYDACEPLRIVVNPREAIPGAEAVLQEAIEEIERASGLDLVVEGTTTESDSRTRPVEDGDDWAPVLVEWSDPDTHELLEGSVAGYAGSSSFEISETRWYVTGSVVLDGPDLARLDRDTVRAIIMHELGHLLGLDHVDDEAEVMNEIGVAATSWGPGDLAGLAELGEGGCVDG